MLHLSQSHYDFGMRSLKAVLVVAGSRRSAAPDLPEELVLIKAMKDANIPKLTSEVIVMCCCNCWTICAGR
jgi:dynein heavy chain